MLDTADGVVDKGEAKSELDTTLDGKRKTCDEAGNAQALEVKTDEGSGEVGDGEAVESDGEGRTSDSVPGGATEPCLLELVDGQMGRDWSVEALVNEDLLALLLGDLDGTLSAMHVLDFRSLIVLVERTGWEMRWRFQQPEHSWRCSEQRKAWPRLRDVLAIRNT